MFTKLVAAVAATIMVLLVRILCYLDDILVLSSSPAQAAQDIERVISIFQRHSFSINLPKSHLTPTTCILHLGAEIDSALGQVFLSPERLTSIREMLQ